MPFPIDPRYILSAEQKLGAKLPRAYAEKMRQLNGGTLELADDDWELHPILDEADPKRIARTCNDILRETEEARDWDGFPEHALSIARNGTGNRLVLLRNSDTDDYGDAVYLWDHETQALSVLGELFQPA